MKNNIKVYKVVRRVNGQLRSIIKSSSGREVVYQPNKLIRPKSGFNQYLYVFDNILDAENFAGRYRNALVFKAEANNVRLTVKDMYGSIRRVMWCPQGTLFASSVKLLKRA